MRSPLETLRAALAGYVEASADAERAILRAAPDDDPDRAAAARARRGLGTGEVREALEQCTALGLIAPVEHAASLSLLARAAREEVLARRGIVPRRAIDPVIVSGEQRSLGALAVDLGAGDPARRERAWGALGEALARGSAARHEADEEARAISARVRARGPRAEDDAPADLRERASAFLSGTDDAMREALARAAHAAGIGEPRTALDALAALRLPAIDPLVPPRERARRLARSLAPLGLDALLASATRLDPAHALLDPGAHVVAHGARAIVAPPGIELGLASEAALARGLGRAIAALLASRALPIALRPGAWGSVHHAIGELVAGLLGDAVFLRRVRALDPAAIDPLRRAAVAQSLARARTLAARVASGRDRERRDRGAESLARALAAPDPTMPAGIADPGPPAPDEETELRAALAAPGIARALRDRFDEDWFRDPRAAEPLRGAAARGLGLAVETWSAELGAPRPEDVLADAVG